MADSVSLNRHLESLAPHGIVISSTVRAALAASLVVLQKSENFSNVQLWGRVQGTTRDYYVAVGVGATVAQRKYFFGTDGVVWAQLPAPHPTIAASLLKIRTRFTGDAAAECVVAEPAPGPDVPPVSLPADMAALRSTSGDVVTTRTTEELRLAAAVAAVDSDCLLLPRGALVKSPTGTLVHSRLFGGLSAAAGTVLHNYFKQLKMVAPAAATTRAGYEPAIDCFEPISHDEPQGVWALTLQHGAAPAAVLKSLRWPGFVFVHTLQSTLYASVYFGTLIPNSDLAFMLP